MFALSDQALDLGALHRASRHIGAGGYASFEGWVRDHNEGRQVRSLEYEAYPGLALKEGRLILDEARERFGVIRAACVHRTGHLGLEDIAVWVGVSAAHRGEAFAACRYIIDEVKHRVPIWKKEHYVDGDSGWVNCERCATHGHEHHEIHAAGCDAGGAILPADYYARQLNLADVGLGGQKRLGDARVLVVGAGGLGAAALPALAAAGVGHIGICEADRLEVSNLHRQTIYRADQVTQPKGELAAAYLRALNPLIKVEVHPNRITAANIEAMLAPYDIVLDCTDNFEAKFLLNDGAMAFSRVLVQASIYQYEGQLLIVNPHRKGPCLRCIWPEMPAPDCTGSCAEAGVLGSVPAILGAMQAMEALKIILDLPRQPETVMTFIDLLTLRMRQARVPRDNPRCRCHQPGTSYPLHCDEDLEIPWETVEKARCELVLIDIREERDQKAAPVAWADIALPASKLLYHGLPTVPHKRSVLCCTRGLRSRQLAQALRDGGDTNVYSLKDGLNGLKA